MKIITSFIKKIILLAISSLAAAFVVIALNTTTTTVNKERNEQIQIKIDKLYKQIVFLDNNIKNRPEKGWKKYWNEYKNYQDRLKIFALKAEIESANAQKLGADPEFWDAVIKNCRKDIFLYAFYIFVLLALSPLLVSLMTYFVIARFVEKSAPIAALKKAPATQSIDMTKAQAALTTHLSGNEHLYLRGGWKGATCNLQAQTRFMWQWQAPLITFAADLFELVDFSAENSEGDITITAPEPDYYIAEIALPSNSAIVIRPRHLIGITDGIKIKTVWNLRLHNILAGRVRQVILYGNGRVFIYGTQGITENNAVKNNYKIEAARLLGYDAHASYSLCRTETWWHYFRKEAALFDIKIEKGIFLTQTISYTYSKTKQNAIEKCVNFVLNGIGSFLGL